MICTDLQRSAKAGHSVSLASSSGWLPYIVPRYACRWESRRKRPSGKWIGAWMESTPTPYSLVRSVYLCIVGDCRCTPYELLEPIFLGRAGSPEIPLSYPGVCIDTTDRRPSRYGMSRSDRCRESRTWGRIPRLRQRTTTPYRV